MITRHFDVIVLGRSMGALCAAALLTRRQVRVLVLGQREKSLFYSVNGFPMARRLETTLGTNSPVFERILQELAQTQRFRQISRPPNPRLGYLNGSTRFEMPQSELLLREEIEREFSNVAVPFAEFLESATLENQEINRLFNKDLVWPPATLFERLEANRVIQQLPYYDKRAGERVHPLERFEAHSKPQELLRLIAHFSSHLGRTVEEAENPLSLVRLFGQWSERLRTLELPHTSLEEFFIARIEAHGGSCQLESFASELQVSRGRVTGARIDDDNEWVGAEAIVTNLTGEAIAELSGGQGIARKAKEQWPHVHAVAGRYILNIVVNHRGVPAPLPRESFLAPPTDSLPAVRLKTYPLAELPKLREISPASLHDDKSLIVAEVTFDQQGQSPLLSQRQAILEVLSRYLPFIEEHLVCVDSPHDGLPAWIYEKDATGTLRRTDLDRIFVGHQANAPEPMLPRFNISPLAYGELAGEPLRGPISGTYLVGPSVLPGLGQEGEFLAATSVARIVTKKDGSRQKLRRQMWRRIET